MKKVSNFMLSLVKADEIIRRVYINLAANESLDALFDEAEAYLIERGLLTKSKAKRIRESKEFRFSLNKEEGFEVNGC